MKKISLSVLLIIFSLVSFSQVTITPNPFEVEESITITVDINSSATDCNGLNNPTKVYMHSGVGDGDNAFGISVVGNWGEDDGIGEMTNQGNGIFNITITPETYYNLTTAQVANVVQIGLVFRNADGTQEMKASGCNDFIFDVGPFQASLTSPSNEITILGSGENLNISATNTGGNASYTLSSNGTVINTNSSTSAYNFVDTNITENKTYELIAELDGTTIIKTFSVLVDPGSNIGIMPTSYQDGITYLDDNSAVLVLYATGKDFVYLAGSFNNYQPDASYAMKKDPTRNNKFWIELSDLIPGQIETYQYWVADKTPTTNSPVLVKTADPYSTLVLSPFDDPHIPNASYPNLPSYPNGQEREVTVLQTGQTPYNWQVTDFTKPKKEDLIIYEVLVRDFDADRNYQDIIDKIDYFKNLNINAIELMPVMEFEGNESWGYNTSFHMALDKFYGTEEKFKELIDICHQNGIAVILDIALNHAYGRNPMVRMWMNDPDGDGWGEPNSENPYFNTTAQHSYSVGSDFDHSSPRTKDYVKRVVKHWIEEFNIDGFRWDLTKGFTQSCPTANEGCTNQYQQDRVDILKDYADYSWSLDTDHYVIFEHLGSENEEKEWANYRLDEGKGIIMWGKMTDPYNELTMGQDGNKNIDGIGHNSRPQFNGPRVLGYPESHDEERLMFKNLEYGNSSNSNHNVKDLNTALSRMSALAAVSVMVPGPKMIWHFGDLGMNNSIFTCSDGSYNNDGCKLSTKPQPQWTNNWLTDAIRGQIYADWAKLHALKINEPVFEGEYTINSGNYTPRIDVFNSSIPNSELKHVIILANFDVTIQTINTNFPENVASIWYDLMDATGTTTVNNSASTISIPAGQFRILGNQPTTVLGIDDETLAGFSIYPNPSHTSFNVNVNVSHVEIYDLTGKLVKSFNGSFTRTDTFNISSLKSGLYMVKVQNDNNRTLTSKLVKI
ncbi:alpha-amylase family glycosyl hydrolase [Winogradskyella bathintestinalis]|uniref:Alpha-amylase family glycosyl hydrolase n=1 Tax=Winogradskyella bathintestinalis TaxID=3035208 RepID=A0ABT7ZQD7_9FLAO|nr:alpha-amylase family glycosyl hydrolase [Winogradskyella bathintestinalis]MDN3491227.1 alpha-amylase family glycosyl hydrolase [Winogradskyella bathintestinalis]